MRDLAIHAALAASFNPLHGHNKQLLSRQTTG